MYTQTNEIKNIKKENAQVYTHSAHTQMHARTHTHTQVQAGTHTHAHARTYTPYTHTHIRTHPSSSSCSHLPVGLGDPVRSRLTFHSVSPHHSLKALSNATIKKRKRKGQESLKVKNRKWQGRKGQELKQNDSMQHDIKKIFFCFSFVLLHVFLALITYIIIIITMIVAAIS